MKPSVRASSVEGLRQELKDLRRSVMDLQRMGAWRFDNELEPTDGTGQSVGVVGLGTQASPDVVEWTAGGAAWVDDDAEWIWHSALDSGSRPDYEQAWFVGSFQASATTATVEFSADNQCEVWLNGELLGTHSGFTTRTEAVAVLASGLNVFKVVAQNTTGVSGNPAGFILSVRNGSGTVIFRTSSSRGWVAYTAEPTGWYTDIDTGGGDATLLATTKYAPAVEVTTSTTSTTLADVDSLNLAVTFTVPSSGEVLVLLESRATGPNSGTSWLQWALREGTTEVTGSKHLVIQGALDTRKSLTVLITGLTAGASLTYKWAHSITASGTGKTVYGGATGAALMQVWAA